MASLYIKPYTLTWGVRGPIRVLVLTGAAGALPEDLLAAARDAFQEPLNFMVRVKLHPIRNNPSGRLLARLREELRHWGHLDRPWWWMVGVPAHGRMPKHWTFLKSRGWRDASFINQLEWADVLVYDNTSLWERVTCPIVHWIGRERQWDFNPAGKKAVSVGDPLVLRYQAYRLGREEAKKRGVPVWDRKNGMVLKEYGAI